MDRQARLPMDTILSQALGQDVSKLAAEEKHLLLSRLLAHLAHEIRNPLSSLDIHVQLLTEDLERESPESRDLVIGRLEIIRGELHRLENVVKQYLSLAGPSALDLQATDLRSILDHVCQLLRPEAIARGIRLEAAVPAGLPRIRADPVKLTQALLNLVINALQAVERDGHVDLKAEFDEPTRRLLISIDDDGPGIPEDRYSTVFEPFYSTKADGGGLGLWIVQQIALAHQATIRAGRSPGGGARMLIAFPVPPEEAAHG